jgi:DNA-binding LacI/PurR family transcriptional regulator
MAMEKISQYGYERIGLVVGRDFDRKLGGNYVGGFCAAQKLFDFKHVLPPLLTHERWYHEQPTQAKKALQHWLIKHQPDAVLTALPEVPGLIRELDYRIPQDVAVAGTSVL